MTTEKLEHRCYTSQQENEDFPGIYQIFGIFAYMMPCRSPHCYSDEVATVKALALAGTLLWSKDMPDPGDAMDNPDWRAANGLDDDDDDDDYYPQ